MSVGAHSAAAKWLGSSVCPAAAGNVGAMDGPTVLLGPVEDAARHVEAVADAAGLDPGAYAHVQQGRPAWPPWPQPALSALVGPRGTVLGQLDLRWLHRFEATVGVLDALTASVGGPSGGPSGLSLLVERAVMLGHHGWGPWSAATSCRMVRARDGWLAVNLPREEDLEAVPAWLEVEVGGDAWSQVADTVPERPVSMLVDRAILLGLAVAAVPPAETIPAPGPPLRVEAGAMPFRGGASPRVLDLSSLWAGPLAGWYLARAGAAVTKVESSARPDGARVGTPSFYRRLNAAKELRELHLASDEGIAQLRRLLQKADIVIEASRPRVLESWGIDPTEEIDRGTIWCSITGHGRTGPAAQRVAFGDDAAAGAGLVTYVDTDHGVQPWFIGDAAADPISGVTAALGVLALWQQGRSGHVDVSMRGAVAALTHGAPIRSRR